MRILMMALVGLAYSHGAMAQTSDCDKIKFTTIPIEFQSVETVRLRAPDGQLGPEKQQPQLVTQSFRRSDEIAINFVKLPQGGYRKVTLNNGFSTQTLVKTPGTSNGDTINFVHMTDIDRDLKAIKSDFSLVYEVVTNKGSETKIEQRVSEHKYKGSETITISGCTYPVNVFTDETKVYVNKKLTRTVVQNFSYSPQIKAYLVSEVGVSNADKSLEMFSKTKVVSISTNFVPIQE